MLANLAQRAAASAWCALSLQMDGCCAVITTHNKLEWHGVSVNGVATALCPWLDYLHGHMHPHLDLEVRES